ncbi:MAG: hypothetical protein R2851_28850 [Caldilineaceae bacterium]
MDQVEGVVITPEEIEAAWANAVQEVLGMSARTPRRNWPNCAAA